MNRKLLISMTAAILLAACGKNGNGFDASGSFEADETIVSSELGGKLISFYAEEGLFIPRDSVVGSIDA